MQNISSAAERRKLHGQHAAEPDHPVDDALWFAARGFQVFPVRSCGERLLTARCVATTSAHRIRAWWSRWPDALVAINTDKRSNMMALEVFGSIGERTLLELQAQHGELTPSGEICRADSRVMIFARIARFVQRHPLGPGLSVLSGGERIASVLRHRRPGLRLLDHVVTPPLARWAVTS